MRKAIAGAVAVAALVGWAGPAWAHVTVQPGEAEKGSFSEISFRVPNERDDASTTELRVQLPVDHPIPFVSVKPVVGWEAAPEVTELDEPIESHGEPITEAVSQITWSGGSVAPGEYQDFSISVGPLPDDVDQLVFKAIQVYDSGEEVAWIEEPTAGGEEPEHPAPVLQLVDAEGGAGGHDDGESESVAGTDAGTANSTTEERADVVTVAAVQDDVDDANARANIALVVGAIGIIAGIGGLVLGRRRRAA